jgi:4-hydroxybutyrate CoA-transferase
MFDVETYVSKARTKESYVSYTSSQVEQEFQLKLISAQDAADKVKSGQWVSFTSGREARTIGLALASRMDELKSVHILVPTPSFDFGWYDEGWQDSFDVTVRVLDAISEEAVNTGRVDFDPGTLIPFVDLDTGSARYEPDILFVEISPPDDKGFCSFGNSVWAKKRQVRNAKLVIGEVNKNLIRTYGDNYVHMSEIDFFVEHVSSGSPPRGSLAGKVIKENQSHHKAIAEYVRELIKDGDTIQIGGGRTTEPLVKLGMLDDKHDLGYHSELAPPGIIRLVQEGVINGSRKTINKGKVLVTAIGGGKKEEMEWVNMNPLCWVVDVSYLQDPRVTSAHDNFVAINNILTIDLTGQTTSESIGEYQVGEQGGQLAFVLGSWLSKGGRSIMVLPSTVQTKEGNVLSRIVPNLAQGTAVTVTRTCVDYVVTEYGVARLRGKSFRERCNELISIAHPDFRSELKKAAQRRFWPH